MRKYRVEIIANSRPEEIGFHDFVSVYDVGGNLVNNSIGSTCPNQTSVDGKKSWEDYYGWISAGVFDIETVDHPKFGKCILIEKGGEIPARFPNVNHNGNRILTECFIHSGGNGNNKQWRGSGGCPTVQNNHWRAFIDSVPYGNGVLVIYDLVG